MRGVALTTCNVHGTLACPTPSHPPPRKTQIIMHFVVRVSTCLNGFSYTSQATKITGLVSDIERYIYIYIYV